MRIGLTTPSHVTGLWTRLEPELRRSTCLEQAAQVLVDDIYQQFEESVVLVRVFITVPFDALPAPNRHFVERLAARAGAAQGLKIATPVLSLVGTRGQEEAWSDRRRSKGHVGIPLISSAFVDAIPMIARLLRDLGIPLDWVDKQDPSMIDKTMARTAGLFLIKDVDKSVDQRGRKIITAQDFVEAYDVRAVFGVGGAYVSGQIAVLVVFCRDDVPQSAAECFLALTALFKAKTTRLVGDGRVFTE